MDARRLRRKPGRRRNLGRADQLHPLASITPVTAAMSSGSSSATGTERQPKILSGDPQGHAGQVAARLGPRGKRFARSTLHHPNISSSPSRDPSPAASMRRLLPAVLIALALAACGDGGSNGTDADTLTVASQSPPDTADIRNEMLTPATLRDPRLETLTDAEQRILQDYVNRGIRRDSLEKANTPNTLGGWLDSNLTVGQVIALYQSTEKLEPLPPQPVSPRAPVRPPQEGP